jgi:hypothetical protein
MPLIDLKTDLKSLKYGQDQPGGGSSNQPYIQNDVNNPINTLGFDDGLIRGGAIGAIESSLLDTSRIAKFLYKDVKGYLFLAKQVGLQFSNPRLEIPKNPANIVAGFPDNILSVTTNGIFEPTRTYNFGLNTLAQSPLVAFGGHLDRHGLLPVQSEASKYEAIVTANNNIPFSTDPSKNNRLVSLARTFELGDTQTNNTQVQRYINVVNAGISALNTAISLTGGGQQVPNISPTPGQQIIDKYTGGPGSTYGLGDTLIKRYSYTEDGFLIDQAKRTNKAKNDLAVDGLNNNLYRDTTSNGPSSYPGTPEPQVPTSVYGDLKTYANIRSKLVTQKSYTQKSTEYQSGSVNKDIYVNQFGIYETNHDGDKVDNTKGSYLTTDVGGIGYQNSYGDKIILNFNKWSDISRENRVGSFGPTKAFKNGRKDSINLTPIFSKDTTVYWYGDETPDGQHNIRDLVKFAIQAVNTNTPDIGDFMVFRAYLTQFSDSVDAKWTDINYVGRGNPFYIYTGFNRKIQVGFKVAALSAEEMQPMYSKLNYLMANLMPDYENNLMRGPLVRLTVGNYLDAQLGKLDSVSYTIPQDAPWEIAIDEPEGGTKQLILPHIIEVSMNFTPIGAETGANLNGTGSASNKIEEKGGNTSYLAQNTTGADVKDIQYYNNFFNAEKIK